MSGPVDWAFALSGPGATKEQIVRQLYDIRAWEHKLWWGETRPFPSYEEWIDQQLELLDEAES